MEPDLIQNSVAHETQDDLGPNLIRMKITDQIKELQTVLRDKSTSRSDFIFHADRLIRLVVEEGLNQLPYTKCSVITPTGYPYDGLKYERGNCGVSIMRSEGKLTVTLQWGSFIIMIISGTGNTVIQAINVLREHEVKEHNIIILNLFTTPAAVRSVLQTFPEVKLLTSEVHPVAPNHFGTKYFGTD
ncbi:uracil phosphoribosyltransferase homolog [Lingula anatina]|uniref:Uracil phosphoribosyltransferase homolog n=1 Tax=Lingula anatina TaxID=7574 RepID=A0A1S3IUR5_LINAN|nr:uracil phosphoribosyltransferase homolog [Lingula anatina]|eukprot:XP_013401676.1 uracil phosphoribosyltransferase homolog [Lingula anatina]